MLLPRRSSSVGHRNHAQRWERGWPTAVGGRVTVCLRVRSVVEPLPGGSRPSCQYFLTAPHLSSIIDSMADITKFLVAGIAGQLNKVARTAAEEATALRLSGENMQLLVSLENCGLIRDDLARAEELIVAALRDHGVPWQQIADANGITRQRAHQKWAQLRTDGFSAWTEPKIV